MARTFYGGSPADVIAQVSSDDGDYAPATAEMTAWTAATGGTQITDLLDVSSSPIVTVTPDALGRVRFYGPDNYSAAIWLQTSGGVRWRIDPADMASRLNAALGGNTYTMPIWDGEGPHPLRPTFNTESTIVVRWRQPTAPLTTSGYALPGDEWMSTAP